MRQDIADLKFRMGATRLGFANRRPSKHWSGLKSVWNESKNALICSKPEPGRSAKSSGLFSNPFSGRVHDVFSGTGPLNELFAEKGFNDGDGGAILLGEGVVVRAALSVDVGDGCLDTRGSVGNDDAQIAVRLFSRDPGSFEIFSRLGMSHWRQQKAGDETAGLVFCPPSDQGEVIAALAISFSVWQCAGHGDAAGLGFVH